MARRRPGASWASASPRARAAAAGPIVLGGSSRGSRRPATWSGWLASFVSWLRLADWPLPRTEVAQEVVRVIISEFVQATIATASAVFTVLTS